MDKSSNDACGSTAASHPQPTLSRESTVTVTPTTEFSRLSRKASHTSTVSSIGPSPLASRESSPSRQRQSNSRPPSSNTGTWSRKNSQQDLRQPDASPTRIPKASTAPVPPAAKKALSSSVPSLPPVVPDITVKAPVPDRPPSSTKWPVSPRLKSPPPNLSKPNIPPPRKDPDSPAVNVPRACPPQPSGLEPPSQSDTEPEEVVTPTGMRTPRAGGLAASTLETVEEVSPFSSPKGIPEGEEEPEDSLVSETSSQQDVLEAADSKSPMEKPNLTVTEAASENSSTSGGRRSGSVAPPPLMSRQSSTSTKINAKGKGEAGLQSMTVETETVVSIPQVALAPPGGAPGTNGSLRTKPSAETIRPKKEKKRQTRRPPSVNAGIGEPPRSSVVRPGLRLRHHQSIRSISSAVEACVSPTKPCYYDDAYGSRPHSPAIRSQSLVFPPVGSLLTKNRPASSKADVFEAKVASAVEEANSSDSEETFVYDSNPPDRDRPQRFHSRTPSTTSMASQVDRGGMRSIHSVLEGPAAPAVKKNMKFVNSINSYNSNGNDGAAVEDDGKGTSRSHIGSTRGTTRQHHQFNRFGRNVGNGHASIFAEESPFAAPPRNLVLNARHSPGPTSPRAHMLSSRITNSNGKRSLGGIYDLEDTTGADDERTPLMPSSVRSARSGRNRRYGGLRTMEQQSYRSQPTMLNRFANCLVLTVMLLLVVTGAIGFMFATSQPLQNIELVSMKNVVASAQELMLDITVQAKNPNVVVVVVDSADIEVFAKSPHAGTDSEWWRRPRRDDKFRVRRRRVPGARSADDDPSDDKAPNMRLGTITDFDSPLSFAGSFFREGLSSSTAEVRLIRPGNGTESGSERWERILQDEFDLIIKGVLRYTLPLSQNVRSVSISGRTTVKPNSANDPLKPNGTDVSVSWRR